MPVNVKLLKKVRKLIAEEPRRLRMRWWGRNNMTRLKNPPPCGTCLAGHIILASTPRSKHKKLFSKNGSMKSWFLNGKISDSCSSYHKYIDEVAAKRIGIAQDGCPFHHTTWKVQQVLTWIDRQIEGAGGS